MTTTNQTRTITLTGRPPVKIVEAEWSVIAHGSESESDGQVECQANRRWNVSIRARRHADGRAIVYGHAEYDTNWQHERSYMERAGVLIPADADLADAIGDVARTLAVLAPDQAERIGRVARECIADLPAETI